MDFKFSELQILQFKLSYAFTSELSWVHNFILVSTSAKIVVSTASNDLDLCISCDNNSSGSTSFF
jgi:hypothetical protein